MLVKLYTLPPLEPAVSRQREAGIDIRRALAPEKHIVVDWMRRHWSPGWTSEVDTSFAGRPIGCFVAVEGEALVGFGCYDTTMRNFFGPTGVLEAYRGRGIGFALLLVCLHAMAADGYGYAIIGAAGPVDFYSKAVGALAIDDSWPGVYRGILRAMNNEQ